VCENAHRAKGLEADTVILVCLDDDVRDELLYVGISRAIGELVVVGPDGLHSRLGLRPG
jgi:superfamily I DNA/RNA helicase